MKELVELIAQALVDRPDAVKVKEIEGNQATVLELRVGDGDLGKVIGKQGRTARASAPCSMPPAQSSKSGSCWKSWNNAAHDRAA